MKVIIYKDFDVINTTLQPKVQNSLEELGLTDFIELEESSDTALRDELKIKQSPALIIEEETIDFKDVIFEWIEPEDEEIKSMFVSIIGGGSTGGWCGTGEWWCGTCTSC